MRRRLTALIVLAAPLVAQEPAEPAVPEEECDHFASEGRIFRGERDAPAVFVRLREAGYLQVKAGEEWKESTLDDLSSFLATARDEYELAQRKIGKSGLEDVEGGGKATRLFLSLEVEPTVPWQHVQFVMTIAAEQKYRKLEFSEGKRKLLAFLPVDRAVCGFSEDYKPPPVVKASIHLVARSERPEKPGEAEIPRPPEVRFKCGDTETADLAEVTAYLRKVKRTVEERKDPKVIFYGEIKAGHKVPYAKVFDVMETFVAAEIPAVGFYGTAIPPKEMRKTKPLPR